MSFSVNTFRRSNLFIWLNATTKKRILLEASSGKQARNIVDTGNTKPLSGHLFVQRDERPNVSG